MCHRQKLACRRTHLLIASRVNLVLIRHILLAVLGGSSWFYRGLFVCSFETGFQEPWNSR